MNSSVLRQAIWNNASWCAVVASSHGIDTELHGDVWLCRQQMPPLYPNIITLQPTTDIDRWLDQLSGNLANGWGIKDSFATLDLGENNCKRVFTAEWYYRPAEDRQSLQGESPVVEATCATGFDRWEQAWRGDQLLRAAVFVPGILGTSTVRLLYVPDTDDGAKAAGGMALHISGNVVGISNLFGDHQSIKSCLASIATLYPQRGIVGYGDDEELAMLEETGFSRLGNLQIWLRG